MQESERLKEKVAEYSFKYLLDNINASGINKQKKIILGIGSGTTIKYFISLLAKNFHSGFIPFDFVTISSSNDSEVLCRELKLPISQVSDLQNNLKIDYYIDGADEVDPQKRCLKGLGGASTREKLLRIDSREFFVLIDVSKKVDVLCSKQPIVVEILPFGFEKTLERIKISNPTPTKTVMRRGTGKMGFVITDNNNYLVDVYYTNSLSANFDFKKLEITLKEISGVIETGLFADPANVVFISDKDRVEVLK